MGTNKRKQQSFISLCQTCLNCAEEYQNSPIIFKVNLGLIVSVLMPIIDYLSGVLSKVPFTLKKKQLRNHCQV